MSDPLCSIAPAIDYVMDIGSWSNGQVRLYGSHDQAPSYEWRVKSGYFANFNLFYTFESRGLEYLLPVTPKAHVDISGRVVP